MKISFKSAAEAFTDLKLGSILNPAITKGPKDARVFTAATLLLKDASVFIESEPTNKVREVHIHLNSVTSLLELELADLGCRKVRSH